MLLLLPMMYAPCIAPSSLAKISVSLSDPLLLFANYCLTTPLVTGGSCVLQDSLTNYRCDCLVGWGGRHCQSVDNCAPDPCQNQAVCTSTAQGESETKVSVRPQHKASPVYSLVCLAPASSVTLQLVLG